jgi:hypothetical protein
MYVTGKLFSIFISFNENGFVPALKQMSGPVALDIEISGIGTINMLHNLGKIPQWRFYRL